MKCVALGLGIIAIIIADVVFFGGLAVRQIGLANIAIGAVLEIAVIGFMAKPIANTCGTAYKRRRSGTVRVPDHIPALDGEIMD